MQTMHEIEQIKKWVIEFLELHGTTNICVVHRSIERERSLLRGSVSSSTLRLVAQGRVIFTSDRALKLSSQ